MVGYGDMATHIVKKKIQIVAAHWLHCALSWACSLRIFYRGSLGVAGVANKISSAAWELGYTKSPQLRQQCWTIT